MKLPALLQGVASRLNERRYKKILPCILYTPPLAMGGMPFTLLSMVHHRDVEPYLVAAKSFARFLRPGRVVVVTDPSITDTDRQVIGTHIPGVHFIPAEDMREKSLPQGGCWERLSAISDLVADDYIVQLDADTVTLAEPVEVRQCIENRRSFVLATEDGQTLQTCAASAAWAKNQFTDAEHIQGMAECRLDTVDNAAERFYVRGCAGFSGFAPGSFNRDSLRQFSAHMAQTLAEKWSAWGTEQFTSNFMVANAPGAVVLPHPKYCHPGREKPGTVFLHFIGYVRFATPRYAEATSRVCAELRAAD